MMIPSTSNSTPKRGSMINTFVLAPASLPAFPCRRWRKPMPNFRERRSRPSNLGWQPNIAHPLKCLRVRARGCRARPQQNSLESEKQAGETRAWLERNTRAVETVLAPWRCGAVGLASGMSRSAAASAARPPLSEAQGMLGALISLDFFNHWRTFANREMVPQT